MTMQEAASALGVDPARLAAMVDAERAAWATEDPKPDAELSPAALAGWKRMIDLRGKGHLQRQRARAERGLWRHAPSRLSGRARS